MPTGPDAPDPDIPGLRISYPHIERAEGKGAPIFIHKPLGDDPTVSDFSILFKTLLPRLKRHAWIFEGGESFSLIAAPDEMHAKFDEWVKVSQASGGEAYYCDRPDFITEFARYVDDDWNSLYAYPAGTPDLDGLAAAYSEDGYSPHAVTPVEVIFENWDGVYWAVFSRRPEFLKLVNSDLADRPGIEVEPTSLERWRRMS